ncbi:hypothetical protein BO79DRAFT_274385 [Aspergillus costaricaensis CBS 115574]|uniref:Uncharacterized protein n=1 Tax=Aspergillus costaricaensis CBS 115574 TaxID=1448317 RepID=A0ACD1I3S9_9EURO|nr:hypothetical protein BO79DRAFT_274385 [Aspergillus costaricaensis CBS 115574]RAK84718.1 hypothetical protein BO79DRAFT_274385 [Aspergillus costaricaensis CBS 115574]
MSVPTSYQQPLKRVRVVRACEQCRTRKVKCNGEDPCLACWQHNQACRYGEARLGRGHPSKKLKTVKSPTVTDGVSTPTFILNSDLSGRERPKAKSSKFQASARYNPEEYRQQLELRAGIGVANSQTGSFQFYGPSSHFCFIQRLYQRMKRQPHGCLLDKPKSAVPAGLGEWGLERFMFAAGSGAPRSSSASTESFLPKDLGDRCIAAYFAIIHPHMPVLDRLVITRLWERLWEAPSPGQEVISRNLVYMVLALGARTMAREGSHSAELLDRWADHFWSQSNDYGMLFQEPCLKGIHFLLLKAMYALHGMRPNDAYLYLGHAARSVLALGLNRGQVANGTGPVMQKLRITFWVVYSYERICAFFTGRPSGFLDSHIDVSFPEDLPDCNRQTPCGEPMKSSDGPLTECAYLRAMAQIGQLIEKVSSGIFSSSNLHTIYDHRKLNTTILECDAALQQIERSLPSYLQFASLNRPKSEVWREIQCTHLGLAFHLIKMMTRRPAMNCASGLPEVESLQASINLSILSAKEIINIASSAIMERATCIRNDASVANYIVSACVTLLYDVLNTSVTVEHALDIFTSVERGIQCLDKMEHHGPITGKALSLDIMKCAKDALFLSTCEVDLEENLAGSFPWLK